MGKQPSSVDLLPDDVRAELQELLRDRRLTQIDATRRVNEILAKQGSEQRLSKSAVNRYALQMEEAGAKLRQSREMAELWIGKLGATPGGQVGHLVNEILRTLSFDMALMLQRGELDAENAPEVVGMMKNLALTLQRLEASSNLNVKREAEIRRQALEDAANAVGETASEAGVSPETIARIRRDVLRMSA